MVETPVGMKCREHGLAPIPPHHRVSAAGYAVAIPVGLVLSAIGSVLTLYIPFVLAAFIIGPVAGGIIGEAISYCTRWKRGPRLAAVAAVTVVVGGASAPFVLLLVRGGVVLHGDAWRAAIVLEPLPLLFAALAAAAAYWRVR